ncbi:MAG: hypothetical protein ONB16_09060 [candidate division KSB1 bacterium]|nr:hypothetical protein [candidate division KSB1 bacterium]MDZ7319177.1 hypothetical protein [candidate division KSB1 bacterium]MDZ7339768.1 hypothetical protein [candidate division KSB1 bacterium]
MQLEQDDLKMFSLNRSIRWGVAAFFMAILVVAFLIIHSYLHGTVKDGLSGSYLTFVLTFMIVWFLGVIFFIIYLIMKYDPQRNPDSPYLGETLSLPPGVFRSIITLTLLIAVVLLEGYAITNIEQHEQIQKVLDPLFTAFQLMIAFYFGTKMVDMISGKGKQETPPKG